MFKGIPAIFKIPFCRWDYFWNYFTLNFKIRKKKYTK